jgi:NTE family protein
VADNTPLKETLERLDWDQVRDPAHMRVSVSASDIENGKTVYFSNLDPNQRLGPEHVLASGSFPGGFPWTMIGDRRYWDGGLTDNTPLHPVIDNLRGDEPATMPIYVIDVNTRAEPKLPTNLLEVQLRASEMLLQNNLETDTHRAESYNRFINLLERVDEQLPADAPVRKDADWDEVMGYSYVRNVHVVDMKKPAGETPFDFAPESIERRLREGYEQMCKYLDSTPPATPGSATASPSRNTPASSSPATPD